MVSFTAFAFCTEMYSQIFRDAKFTPLIKGIGCRLKEIGRDPYHLISFITSTKIKLTMAVLVSHLGQYCL